MLSKILRFKLPSTFLPKSFFSESFQKIVPPFRKSANSSSWDKNNSHHKTKEATFQTIPAPPQGKLNIYKLLTILGKSTKLDETTLLESLTVLQTHNLREFEKRPKNLIYILQRLAKQDWKLHSNFTEQRKNAERRVVQFFYENFDNLKRLDVIMYLWIDAKLGIYNPSMIKKSLNYIENNFSELSEQDTINYLYSSTKIIDQHGDIITPETQSGIIQEHIKKMRPLIVASFIKILASTKNEEHLTNLLWIVARLEFKEQELLEACSQRFAAPAISFNNANFAKIINCFIHMEYTPEDLLKHFTFEFLKRVDTLTPAHLDSIVRAFYLSNTVNLMEILDGAKSYIQKNINRFSEKELVALLKPYAITKSNGETTSKLLDRIQERLSTLSIDDLCRTLWSISLLQNFKRLDFMLQIAELIPIEKLAEMKVIDVHQAGAGFFTLIQHIEENNVHLEKIESLKKKYEAAKQAVTQTTLSIRYQTFRETKEGKFSAYRTFKTLGLNVIPECVVEIYNVDFAVVGLNKNKLLELEQKIIEEKDFAFIPFGEEDMEPKKDVMILDPNADKSDTLLFELNGKYHFIGDSLMLKASTLLKSKHLKNLGYTLVSMTAGDLARISSKETDKEIALRLINFIKARI